ncbi:MAG: enoyl-CoA hydratase/isomerase family protein [Promethearchaeota archaeon]
MTYDEYKLLKIKVKRGVAFTTINNPPINLINIPLVEELVKFTQEVEMDNNVRVIVFDSADPEIFLAHYDVGDLAEYPDVVPPKSSELHPLNKICEAFRRMSKVTIAKIEGRCRGGGSEFVLALDMRFGAIDKAILAQPEVLVGIIPGGGGTQRLPRLIGQARALEVILSGNDISAELAEKYGYINRAFPASELTVFVNALAYRIASIPSATIALAKQAVLVAEQLPIIEGLLEETYLFGQSCALPEAKERMKRYLQLNGQSRESELR